MMRNIQYKIAFAACTAVIILTSACNKKDASGGKPTTGMGAQTATAAGTNIDSKEIFLVETAIARPYAPASIVSAIGTIRHIKETPVSFTQAGRITSLKYKIGDYIRQGSVLASLSYESMQMVSGGSGSGASDTESAAAYARFAKIEQLYRDGWVTKKQYESAQVKADISRAQAQAPVAVVKHSAVQLYSPVSGVVLSRMAEVGQMVGPGSPAYMLGQDNLGFTFRAPVTAADAAKLKIGMRADINIEKITSAPLLSSVSLIEMPLNKSNAPVMVQFKIGPQKGLTSGLIGTVSIAAVNDTGTATGFTQIPASALFGLQDRSAFVYVVNASGRTEIRSVVIDKMLDGFAVVTGSIIAGDSIVIGDKEKLRNGARVSPKPAKTMP